MSNVFPRVNVTGKPLLALVLCVALDVSCGESARLPTSSSPTPVPTPIPAPGTPVAAENVTFLPAPTMLPPSAADPLVGRYTLEIVAVTRSGLRCEMVPEHARRRIYTADIHQFRDYYAVKLYDATFLRDGTRMGYGCVDTRLEMGGVCHQFIMKRDGDGAVSVDMTPLDEWRGSEIWEIENGHLIQLHGHGTGPIDEGRILASGSGGVWYGNGIPATDSSACGPGDIAWTFTRR